MRCIFYLIPLSLACQAVSPAQDEPLALPIGYVATACGPGPDLIRCLKPKTRTPTPEQRAALDAAFAAQFRGFNGNIGVVDSNEDGSIIGTAFFPMAGSEHFLFTPGRPIIFQDSPGCCARVEYHSINNNGLVVGGFGGGPILTDVLHGIVLGPNFDHVNHVAYVIPDPRFPDEYFGVAPPGAAYTTFDFINERNWIDAKGGYYQQRYVLKPVSRKTKNRCKQGEWENFPSPPGPFRNQRECIRYFTHLEE